MGLLGLLYLLMRSRGGMGGMAPQAPTPLDGLTGMGPLQQQVAAGDPWAVNQAQLRAAYNAQRMASEAAYNDWLSGGPQDLTPRPAPAQNAPRGQSYLLPRRPRYQDPYWMQGQWMA